MSFFDPHPEHPIVVIESNISGPTVPVMPEIGPTGEEIYDNMEPAQYAELETNYSLARFLAAISELLDPIADVTRAPDGSDRWLVLASPTRCPVEWLPVLAQWAGVRRRDSMSEADLRELIGPHGPGMWRGTRQSMWDAVKRFYPPGTPDNFLYFEERADGNAYALRVFTYSFVQHDEAAVRSALLHAKPAGLTLLYEVRVGQTWGMLDERMPTWGDTVVNYASWYELMHDTPLEAP